MIRKRPQRKPSEEVYIMAAKSLTIALGLALLLGCGGNAPSAPPNITGAQVFTARMIGQTWTFQNAYGDITTITVSAAPTTNYVPIGCAVWDFKKNNARAYWSPGNIAAENLQVLCPQPDGSWNSIMNLSNFPAGQAPGTTPFVETQQVQPSEPGKLPYILIPANGSTSVSTSYLNYIDLTQLTYNSIVSPGNLSPFFPTVPWTTNGQIAQVDTPIYKGPALVSDQHEGIVNERWYFAPGLGLVQIQPVHGGSDTEPETIDGANLTIKRIH
jgi:hypothetical protein